MKILLSHRFFWPDSPPYAGLLKRIAHGLSTHGFVVHVFSSRPSYRKASITKMPRNDVENGVSVVRCSTLQEEGASAVTRIGNSVWYCLGLFWRILKLRPDIVTASTYPPVFAAFTGSLGAKLVGARFVYHMQDIHPEVSEISGDIARKGVISRLLRWIDNSTLRRSTAIVVLSRDMLETLNERGIGGLSVHIINNFSLAGDDEAGEVPAEYRKDPSMRRIIFAGNIGRYQNLNAVTEGISKSLAKHPDLQLFFLGDGKMLGELKARWLNHPQILFARRLPPSVASKLIAQSDVGIVSLTREMHTVAYPSKTLTYLSLGIPVLAVVEPNSSLAKELRRAEVGAIPNSDSPEDIASTLEVLLEETSAKKEVADWYRVNFSEEICVRNWCQLLRALG